MALRLGRVKIPAATSVVPTTTAYKAVDASPKLVPNQPVTQYAVNNSPPIASKPPLALTSANISPTTSLKPTPVVTVSLPSPQPAPVVSVSLPSPQKPFLSLGRVKANPIEEAKKIIAENAIPDKPGLSLGRVKSGMPVSAAVETAYQQRQPMYNPAINPVKLTGGPAVMPAYNNPVEASLPEELPFVPLPTIKSKSKFVPSEPQEEVKPLPVADHPISASITASKKELSFFDKVLRFFGLATASPATMHGEALMTPASQRAAAEAVVRRVRSGDQNAMALMALVRDNAATNPRARLSFMYMKQYIDSHPVTGTRMHGEYEEGIRCELGD